jgi:hypothetical protein
VWSEVGELQRLGDPFGDVLESALSSVQADEVVQQRAVDGQFGKKPQGI